MTTGQKILMWVVIFLALIGFYFIGTAQGWWRNIFAPKPAIIPDKTDTEKCTEANKSKRDGEECANCVAEGSGMPSFNGTIKDGVCVKKSEPAPTPVIKRYMIRNQNGAIVYIYSNGNFNSPKTPNRIPYGTEVRLISVSPKRDFYLTDKGWVSANDIAEKLN